MLQCLRFGCTLRDGSSYFQLQFHVAVVLLQFKTLLESLCPWWCTKISSHHRSKKKVYVAATTLELTNGMEHAAIASNSIFNCNFRLAQLSTLHQIKQNYAAMRINERLPILLQWKLIAQNERNSWCSSLRSQRESLRLQHLYVLVGPMKKSQIPSKSSHTINSSNWMQTNCPA